MREKIDEAVGFLDFPLWTIVSKAILDEHGLVNAIPKMQKDGTRESLCPIFTDKDLAERHIVALELVDHGLALNHIATLTDLISLLTDLDEGGGTYVGIDFSIIGGHESGDAYQLKDFLIGCLRRALADS